MLQSVFDDYYYSNDDWNRKKELELGVWKEYDDDDGDDGGGDDDGAAAAAVEDNYKDLIVIVAEVVAW